MKSAVEHWTKKCSVNNRAALVSRERKYGWQAAAWVNNTYQKRSCIRNIS